MLDEIIIQTKDGIMQIAGLEKGRLGEFVIYDEKKANEGNVYLGKITKKIQTANGKEGYFVNIGAQREAFINAEEKDLEDLKAHEGQDIIVQVVQEQRAEKGARMSRFLRLGYYCSGRSGTTGGKRCQNVAFFAVGRRLSGLLSVWK